MLCFVGKILLYNFYVKTSYLNSKFTTKIYTRKFIRILLRIIVCHNIHDKYFEWTPWSYCSFLVNYVWSSHLHSNPGRWRNRHNTSRYWRTVARSSCNSRISARWTGCARSNAAPTDSCTSAGAGKSAMDYDNCKIVTTDYIFISYIFYGIFMEGVLSRSRPRRDDVMV